MTFGQPGAQTLGKTRLKGGNGVGLGVVPLSLIGAGKLNGRGVKKTREYGIGEQLEWERGYLYGRATDVRYSKLHDTLALLNYDFQQRSHPHMNWLHQTHTPFIEYCMVSLKGRMIYPHCKLSPWTRI